MLLYPNIAHLYGLDELVNFRDGASNEKQHLQRIDIQQ